jgi:hypothetical protein
MCEDNDKLQVYIEEYKQACEESRHRSRILYTSAYLFIITSGVLGTGIASTLDKSNKQLVFVLILSAGASVTIGVLIRKYSDALSTSYERRRRSVNKINDQFSDSNPLTIHTNLPKNEYGGPIAEILSGTRLWRIFILIGGVLVSISIFSQI